MSDVVLSGGSRVTMIGGGGVGDAGDMRMSLRHKCANSRGERWRWHSGTGDRVQCTATKNRRFNQVHAPCYVASGELYFRSAMQHF